MFVSVGMIMRVVMMRVGVRMTVHVIMRVAV